MSLPENVYYCVRLHEAFPGLCWRPKGDHTVVGTATCVNVELIWRNGNNVTVHSAVVSVTYKTQTDPTQCVPMGRVIDSADDVLKVVRVALEDAGAALRDRADLCWALVSAPEGTPHAPK